MAQAVSKVTVYRFRKYDIGTDEHQVSRRWGTLEGIESVRGTVIEDTATEVDASAVGAEIPGLTSRNFQPNPRIGFQTQVKAYMSPTR
jgi:hypothetical protein